MPKIISILRKTEGAPNVPSLIVTGRRIAEDGAIVKDIKYFEYRSNFFTGSHFVVYFVDTSTRVVIPLSAVLDIVYDVSEAKNDEGGHLRESQE